MGVIALQPKTLNQALRYSRAAAAHRLPEAPRSWANPRLSEPSRPQKKARECPRTAVEAGPPWGPARPGRRTEAQQPQAAREPPGGCGGEAFRMTHAAGNSLMTGNIFTSGLVHSFLLRTQRAPDKLNTKAHSGRFPFPVKLTLSTTPRPGRLCRRRPGLGRAVEVGATVLFPQSSPSASFAPRSCLPWAMAVREQMLFKRHRRP